MTTHIKVRATEKGLEVLPETAEAKLGEAVNWHFSWERAFFPFKVTIYFSDGSPFNWSIRYLNVDSQSELNAAQDGIAEKPKSPGKFKYGVKINDFRNGNGVDDVDPYLIVRG